VVDHDKKCQSTIQTKYLRCGLTRSWSQSYSAKNHLIKPQVRYRWRKAGFVLPKQIEQSENGHKNRYEPTNLFSWSSIKQAFDVVSMNLLRKQSHSAATSLSDPEQAPVSGSGLRPVPDIVVEKEDLESGLKGDSSADASSSTTSQRRQPHGARTTKLIASLILFIGTGACGIILAFGITAAKSDQKQQFEILATETVRQFELVWDRYEMATLWIHQATRTMDSPRKEFRELYEYLRTNLDFHSIAYSRNVSLAERPFLEAETRQVYSDFPYQGFVELNTTLNMVFPEGPKPFYFPMHQIAPIEDYGYFLDYDLYADPVFQAAIDEAVTSGRAALSCRHFFSSDLIGISEKPVLYNAVALLHPGVVLTTDPVERQQDFALIAVTIPSLLEDIAQHYPIPKTVSVYVYDHSPSQETEFMFLGGATFFSNDGNPVFDRTSTWYNHGPESQGRVTVFDEETDIEDLRRFKKTGKKWVQETCLSVASRKWTVVVIADDDTFQPDLFFVILGSVLIFLASASLALGICVNHRRSVKLDEIRDDAKAEKAAMMVESARKSARAERELNDFIAHEVRNPLSAAMTASVFVSSAIGDEKTSLADLETRKSIQDDMGIIDASLKFINDLLRNMLDMNRASSNQLRIELAHADLLRDVLEPVASMMYPRCESFEVLLDCPEDLVVVTDCMRLKQILLNLGRNATKFIEKGFIRLRVYEVDKMIRISVEDSGSGIPLEKQDRLFEKFQESLDSMNQGTGVGLCVCRNLVDLMKGDIWLDKTYDSGMEGCPGARFVVELKTPAVALDTMAVESYDKSINCENSVGLEVANSGEESDTVPLLKLPEKLSVLFVDDDLMLRKLFARAVRNVMPEWDVQEAANGESALLLVDKQSYDLIFLDQYMASVEKQLLGTETARALRSKGVKSKICGLSANDIKKSFLESGADAFIMKPLPCRKEALSRELLRILYGEAQES
jgi:signal transduction histidine kinase/CheY-like chemotaxis protein